MMHLLIPLLVALAGGIFLLRLVRGSAGNRRILSLDDLAGRIVPVDLEAFQNLIAPSEDAYLRSLLSPRDYRRMRRLRAKAAIEYLRRVAANAAVLLRLGEAARESERQEIAEAARQLVDTALAVRVNALFAVARLHLSLLWPAGSAFCARAIVQYAALRNVFGMLGRLQNPALNARLAVGL